MRGMKGLALLVVVAMVIGVKGGGYAGGFVVPVLHRDVKHEG